MKYGNTCISFNRFIVLNLKNYRFHRWNYMFFAKKSQADFAKNICIRKSFLLQATFTRNIVAIFLKTICFPQYMHLHVHFQPRTRFTQPSNEVVYLNPDLHRPFQDYLTHRDEPIDRWGETGVPRENHLTNPQAELVLSHMWPVRGSNPHQTQR